jgi:hypothetical protein
VAGGTTSIMSGLLRERPPVVCLWGGHRPAPDLDTRTTPSNADKGARELKGRGYDVRSVSPWTRGKAPSGIARKLQYVTSVADVLKASRPADAVLYTADLPWIRVLAAMKQAGLLRRRLVVHWGGIDFDPQSLSNSTYLRKYDKLFAAIDAIWLASENERQIWSEALPHHADRMAFHPMFVDIEYYRKIMPATLSHDVVAIGSEARPAGADKDPAAAPPANCEIGLVVPDVHAAFKRAVAAGADHVAVVPCCQAEVARQLAAAPRSGPWASLHRHAWHRREFGSHLTNVVRALWLESHGYQVTVTELAGWQHALKNELILGRRVHRESREAQARLDALLEATGVRPSLLD